MFELSNEYSPERTMYCTSVCLKLSTCIVDFLLKIIVVPGDPYS